MHAFSTSEPLTTLADARTGEVVWVQDIIFERTRILCRELGISTGDVLRCADRNGHRLTLQATSGAAIELDPFYACFIAVERIPQV